MKIKARNAFNAMFVDTVNTGVCGSYTTPYTEYYEVWKVHKALLTFLDLTTTRVMQARCTANPQFLNLRGHSATQ